MGSMLAPQGDEGIEDFSREMIRRAKGMRDDSWVSEFRQRCFKRMEQSTRDNGLGALPSENGKGWWLDWGEGGQGLKDFWD